MKLFGSLTSPFVRKVRIVAIEKRLDLELMVDDVWGPESKLGDINPLAKVPTLLVDDTAVYDSAVIVEYLDARAPTHKLVPDGNRDRTAVRTLESLADGLCDAAITMMLEKRFHPGEMLSEAWMERQAAKVDRALARMSHTLDKRQWMHGNSYTLADIACGVALLYLELRFPENTWRTTYPNLDALCHRLMERPAFASTKP
ncbi:MAG: glutathione S-transferase [Betaproteobacteria bacterium]|nr:glutathione S-transferase [Betaproteobacteria bacterium]